MGVLNVIAKLSGVLLAVTLVLYFIINTIPALVREIASSDMNGREYLIGALILLMFTIVVIWGYAIWAFTRSETRATAREEGSVTTPQIQEVQEESRQPDEEIKKMSKF